jgi:hypothetical protein
MENQGLNLLNRFSEDIGKTFQLGQSHRAYFIARLTMKDKFQDAFCEAPRYCITFE